MRGRDTTTFTCTWFGGLPVRVGRLGGPPGARSRGPRASGDKRLKRLITTLHTLPGWRLLGWVCRTHAWVRLLGHRIGRTGAAADPPPPHLRGLSLWGLSSGWGPSMDGLLVKGGAVAEHGVQDVDAASRQADQGGAGVSCLARVCGRSRPEKRGRAWTLTRTGTVCVSVSCSRPCSGVRRVLMSRSGGLPGPSPAHRPTSPASRSDAVVLGRVLLVGDFKSREDRSHESKQ